MARRDPTDRVVGFALIAALLGVGGYFAVSAVGSGPERAPGGLDGDAERLRRAYAALEEVGMALEAHRRAAGAFPDALVELVPDHLADVPADPFAPRGIQLGYSAPPGNPSGRILYSRGPDGVDQGGSPLDPVTGRGDLPYPVR